MIENDNWKTQFSDLGNTPSGVDPISRCSLPRGVVPCPGAVKPVGVIDTESFG